MRFEPRLRWPNQQGRTEKPIQSRFGDHLVREILGSLERELRAVGGSEIVVSSELQLGKSGWPINGWRRDDDHGVAVYWRGNDGRPYVLAIDRYDYPMDNLWAIVKSLEAIRALSRWGGDGLTNQALSSFAELPPPRQWYAGVLQTKSADPSLEECEDAYRRLAKKAHPDAGGSNDQMLALNEAIKAAREVLR